jgi:phosphate transport system ATP-binding protein
MTDTSLQIGLGGIEAGPEQAGEQVRLSVRNLSFYYGKHRVIDNVSIDFPSNLITAIIGPSGCGKSTLLRVLNRIYSLYPGQRAEGTVLLDGQDILSPRYKTNELRTKVGMVLQSPTPFAMSIYDNVALAIRHHEKIHRVDLDERVESALRQAALWDEVKGALQKSAFSLSGGQQQRLCIARAIATEPEIVLMDEPTAALDPIATLKIEDLLTDLATRYTIIIVTHNLQQAARVSDRTAFMLMGKLIEIGSTEKMFKEPQYRETNAYITGRFG